jgi:signal transduction histidine kinase
MIKLRTKITIIVSLVTGVLVVGAALFEARHLIEQGQRIEQENQAVQIANILPSMADGIWDFDQARTESGMRGLFDARATRRVQVIDPQGQVYVGLAREVVDSLPTADSEARLSKDEARAPQVEWNEQRNRTLKFVQLDTAHWRVVAPLWHNSARDRQNFIGHLLVEYSTEESIARSQSMMYRLLIGGFVIALLTVLLVSLALQFFVLKPVDVLMQATEAIAAGNFEKPIALKTKDEMAILAQSFDGMRQTLGDFTYKLQDLVRLRTAQLEDEKRKIQNILIHINEGILTFGQDFRIEAEISDQLTEILGCSREALVGRDVLDLIFQNSRVSANTRDEIQASLSFILGEDACAYEINAGHLPRELYRGERETQILDLDWVPILDESTGLVLRMMLTMRDITEKRAMERRMQEAQEAHAQFLRRISEIVQAGVSRTQKTLHDADQRVHALMNRLAAGETIPYQESFPTLHTLKGNMRSLGFAALTESIHLAEDVVQKQRRGEALDVQSLSKNLARYQSEAHAYLETLERVWGGRSYEQNHFIFSLVDHLLVETRDEIQKAGLSMGRVDVQDGFLQWGGQGMNVLADILVHALANALDHGYLKPRARGQQVGDFHFSFDAQPRGRDVRIVIRDGGCGISTETLQALYQKSGQAFHSEDPFRILFDDAVSTADAVTTRSGRGVGLYAIRHQVEMQGGRVVARSAEGQGFELEIHLPQSVMGREQTSVTAA